MKRGFNHLILRDGRTHHHVVVEFSAEGLPQSWHYLQGEEPFVEWHGGTFRWPAQV